MKNNAKNHLLWVESDVLEERQSLKIDITNIKQDHVINFRTRIKDIEKVIISNGKDKPYSSSFVEIDAHSITSYFYASKVEQQESYKHHLEVRDYLNVIIKVLDDLTAIAMITSVSGSFSCGITWKGCAGRIMVECGESSLTDCRLSFYCPDYDKEIWGFGDSYFGHWPQIINSWGYTNWMVDGYSGRNSVCALESLERCFDFGTPCKVIWALGMNDEDSSDRINQEWLETVKKVEMHCREKNIELILFTIPNVPERKHCYKNDYIRKCGCRYVDIDHATGADLNAEWYEGLLSSDKVHPTTVGAYDIAMRIAMDIPELMSVKKI